MANTRILDEQFDLAIRAAERLGRTWECCGDIVDRHSGKPLGRVYGRAATKAGAEEEVVREAARWVKRGVMAR